MYPSSSHRLLGVGTVASDLDPTDAATPAVLAFACQCLPRPALIGAASVSQLARLACETLMDDLREHQGPWRLHVFTHPEESPPVSPRRCVLVENAIGELLHKKQRRLERTRVNDLSAPLGDDEAIVQVFAASSDMAYWSVYTPLDADVLGRVVSRFPAGLAQIIDDQRPPSRAYRKLLEAEAQLGESITAGQTCVDLGGSPGGWTFIAVDRGAEVVSVDRSPLRNDLMSSPHVTFVRGDAFAFAPEAPVDWLLCDVIAVPERNLEMLCHWLDKGYCWRFCVTLKFKGDIDMAFIQHAKHELEKRTSGFIMRQLVNNKNELTVFGRALRGDAASVER